MRYLEAENDLRHLFEGDVSSESTVFSILACSKEGGDSGMRRSGEDFRRGSESTERRKEKTKRTEDSSWKNQHSKAGLERPP